MRESNSIDAMITFGWNRVSYQILRNLAKYNLNVAVGDTSKHNMGSWSRYSKATFQYSNPNTNPEQFIDDLLSFIAKFKPKVLIPVHEETFIVAKYRDKFPENIEIPISTYDTLITAHDKIQASQLANSIGVPTPQIYSYDEALNKTNFPLVLKLPKSNASKGVFYAHSKQELTTLYNQYKDQNVFIQNYVSGVGYGASFLYKNGKMVTGFVHRRLTEKTHSGGVSTKRVSIKNKTLLELGKKLLDKLNWHGPAMVEFKYDETTQQAWFIEINARYWGSLALPIAAGLDIPYWHYCLATDQLVSPVDYKDNIISKWIIGEGITFVERILKRKLTFKELKSILSLKADNYDDLYFDDLKAFLGEAFYYFSKFIKTGSTNPAVKGIDNV